MYKDRVKTLYNFKERKIAVIRKPRKCPECGCQDSCALTGNAETVNVCFTRARCFRRL